MRNSLKQALITVLILAAACAEELPPVTYFAHDWLVVSTTDKDQKVTKPVHGYVMSFATAGKVWWTMDRHSCSANYVCISDENVAISDLDCTENCCETGFTSRLKEYMAAAINYEVSEDTLVLSGGIGSIKLARTTDCSNVGCQKNLRSPFYVKVTHADGSTVSLTSSRVVRVSDEAILTSETFTSPSTTGNYYLTHDSDRRDFIGREVKVRFEGFIGDDKVASREFTLTGDCCVVSILSGDLNIVI